MNPKIKYTLTAQHFSITPDIEAQVGKTASAIEKYVEHGDESASARFIIRFEKRHTSNGVFSVEIDFHARHADVSAKGENEILVAALDDARDELAEALRTRKEKKIHFVRRGARKVKEFLRGFPARMKK